MGMKVNLGVFFDPSVLSVAAAITVAQLLANKLAVLPLFGVGER